MSVTRLFPASRLARFARVLLAALVVGSSLALVVGNGTAAADRAFGGARFSVNAPGDIVIAANTLLTCDPADTRCTSAQDGTRSSANNEFQMVYVDSDADPATFNSSSATLNMPAGSTVRFAGLYWGGYSNSGARNQVKFETPAAPGYNAVSASVVDGIGSRNYQGFADVTATVQAAGSGTYTVADVRTTEAKNRFAGWSLVVVYENNSEPWRNLSVFDGFEPIRSSNPVDITVSGFITPPVGPITADIGFVNYEGDHRYKGDYAQFQGVRLSDALTATDNFANSVISDGGVQVAGRNPSYVDQLGYDSKIIETVGLMPPSATSATIALRSSGDVYYQGVVTSAIEIYVPNLVLDFGKTVTDVNGGDAHPGDTLTYTIAFSNQGDDPALNVVVGDVIPTGTTYVPNSATVAAGPGTAVFDAGAGEVLAYLGTGSSAGTGGRIDPYASTGDTYEVTFQVTVDPGTESTTVDNVASIDYTAFTLGTDESVDSPVVSTPIEPLADLSMTSKTADIDPVIAGQDVAYTIVVANDGPSPADAVSISDALPAGMTFLPAPDSDPRCSPAAGVVTCAVGVLANGATDSVVIAATVDGTTPTGSVTNKAEVSTTTPDADPNDNTAAAITEITRLVDLTATKVATPNPDVAGDAVAGGAISYVLEIANAGPSDALNAQLVDSLPAGATLVNTPTTGGGGSCATTGTSVTCDWAVLPAGASHSVTVEVDLGPGMTAGTLTNTATATSDDPEDPAGGPNGQSASVDVIVRADLALTKAALGPAVAGETLLYDLTVNNAGESNATLIEVQDTLPVGTIFNAGLSSATCSEAVGVVTCALSSLAAGATGSFTVAIDLPSDMVPGPLVNVATVSAAEPDPNNANNDATDNSTVAQSADLSIVKSQSADPVIAGAPLEYSIAFNNAGPSDASGVEIVDTLPAGTTFDIGLSTAGCNEAGGIVTCVLGDVAAATGGSVTIAVTTDGTLAGGATLANVASIGGSEPDPVAANDDSSTTATVVRDSALEITKAETAASSDPVVAGTSLTYEIEVTNLGTSTESGVSVTDDLSALPVTITGVTGTGCSQTAGVVTCSIGAMTGGQTETITITVTVNAGAADGVVMKNTATASGATAPTVAAVEETTINASADLNLAKAGPASLNAGDTGTWTITLVNDGPSRATDVAITDLLPPGVVFVTHRVLEGVATCAPSGGTVACDSGNVAPGGRVVIELDGSVDTAAIAGSNLVNVALVESPTADPDPSNNMSNSDTTVTRSADLAVAKTANMTEVAAGEPITFGLLVTNNGPSDASNVEISDPVPAGLTFDPATSDAACFVAAGVVTCSLGTLDPDDPPTGFTIGFTVDAGTSAASLTNEATVSATEDDPVAGNDVSAVGFDVVTRADIAVVKQSSPTPIVPGEPVTYTLTVTNNGPSNAPVTTVTDSLPAVLTYRPVGSDGRCSASGQDVTCGLGILAPGAVETLTIVADVAPDAVDNLVNIAAVTSSVPDPTPSNNSSADDAAVSPSADVSIVKTATPDPVNAGQNVTYSLTVENAGPSTATNTVITDTLPAGVTYQAGATDTRCSEAAGVVTCALGELAPATIDIVTIVVRTDPAAAAGLNLSNTAEITSDANDPDLSNNTSSADARIARSADIVTTKVANDPSATAGNSSSFTVTVTNNGPSNASAVVLDDTLPAGLTATAATPSGAASCPVASGPTVQCTAASLAPGQSFSVLIDVDVSATVPDGSTLVNSATATGAEPDPAGGNNTATAGLPIARAAGMSVAKTVSPTAGVAGETVTYTIAATNAGPSDAASVSVADQLPVGMTVVSATPTTGSCTTAPSSVTCDFGDLSALQTESVDVVVELADGILDGEILVNQASVSSATADGDPSDDVAAAPLSVSRSADVSVAKTAATTPTAVAGETVLFELAVTNAGPSTATGVTVDDALPGGLVLDPALSSAGCADSGGGVVQCAIGSLPVGSTANVVIAATVPETAIDPSTLSNTATVAAIESDPTPGNNESTVDVPVTREADVRILKSGPTGAIVAGSPATFVLSVANDGPSQASSVLVTDTLPVGVTFDDAASDAACDETSPGIVTCNFATIDVGTTIDIDIVVNVGSSVADAALITNEAGVAAAETDPDPGDNSSQFTMLVERAAGLQIFKTDLTDPVIAGDSVTWQVDVANNGLSDADDVVVTDTFPAGVTFEDAASDGRCDLVAGQVECVIGTLAPGDSTVVLLVGTTDQSTADGTLLTNSATGSGGPGVETVIDVEETTVQRQVDLVVTKTADVDPVVAGELVTYEVEVANIGPSQASGVELLDILPTVGVVESIDPDGGACAQNGSVLQCAWATLDAGAAVTIVVAVRVPSWVDDGDSFANVASATSNENDATPGDNSSTVDTAVEREIGLSIDKVARTTTGDAGSVVVFDLIIENVGPADATAVSVADTLPAGMTFVPSGSSSSCVDLGGGSLDCPVGDMPAGTAVNLIISAAIEANQPEGATLTNVASVTADETNRSTATSDSASIDVVAAADLSLAKELNGAFIAGSDVMYDLTVDNAGPSDARDVVVVDTVPSGLTFVSSTGTCSESAGVVSCDLGDVAVGSASVSLTFSTDPALVGPLTNEATVSAATADPNPDGDTATATNPVERVADLVVNKTVVTEDPIAGGDLVWLIAVVNNGPSTATDLRVDDPLDPLLTFDAAASSADCLEGVSCSSTEALAPGETLEFTVATTTSPDSFGALTNTASAESAETDPTSEDAEGTVDADVRRTDASLSITKISSLDVAPLASQIVWTIEVRNDGPEAIITPLTITDDLPTGLELVGAASTTATCESANDQVMCVAAEGLAVGATITVEVLTTVTASDGSATNVAVVEVAGVMNANDGRYSAQANAAVTFATAPLALTGGSLLMTVVFGFGLLLAGLILMGGRRRTR